MMVPIPIIAQVIQTGAAAAVAAPLLRPQQAGAIGGPATFDNFPGRAPVISVLDHRGCSRKVCTHFPFVLHLSTAHGNAMGRWQDLNAF